MVDDSNLPSDDDHAEAIGVSKGGPEGWSFEEAFNDAIAQLGSAHPEIPDWMDTYTVVEIGARLGGIAGFNDLLVTVRRGGEDGISFDGEGAAG